MAVSGLYGLLCFPFGLKICNSLAKKPYKHLPAFSLDGQTSLLGVCHHLSQKLAKFSEITQTLISKEWLHVTLQIWQKSSFISPAMLWRVQSILKNYSQHNLVSFFTQIYWSWITYMFPEAKKGADINVNPFVSPWRVEERCEVKDIFGFCKYVCKVLDLCRVGDSRMEAAGGYHRGQTELECFSWGHPWQVSWWKSRAEGSRRMSCSTGFFSGLHLRQGNRKMKLRSSSWDIEMKQNRDGRAQLVHPADNSVMFLWGLAYCSAWC